MQVVVVGSGIAGFTFAEAIHKLNPKIHVILLTRESQGYYSRPLLSNGFSQDDIEAKIVLKSFSALIESGIKVESNSEVQPLTGQQKT